MAILRESFSSGFLLYANIYRRAEVSFHVMSKLRNSPPPEQSHNVHMKLQAISILELNIDQNKENRW